MSYDRVITLRPDTSSNWSTNNPVLSQGEGAIETNTGYIKIGDGSSTYSNLGYITPIVYIYDLISANNTHIFPKVTMKGQVWDIFWTNGGTYSLTLAVSNSETIDGETASTWEGEGEGHIRVISDGTNWQVVSYDDSGSNGYGKWQKYRSGKLICITVSQNPTTTSPLSNAFGTTSGTTYYIADISFTLPHNYINASYICTPITNAGSVGYTMQAYPSTSSVVYGLLTTRGAATSAPLAIRAEGEWK